MTNWGGLWGHIIRGAHKSWVAFEHGTCVVLIQPEPDLAAQATRLLAEWGPVHVGSPAADFNVIALAGGVAGWVVGCHHPDILTYVAVQDMPPEPSDLLIGLCGRQCRDDDAKELRVAHVHAADKT